VVAYIQRVYVQTYTRCSAGLLILQLLQYLLQRFFGIANAVAVLLISILIFIFISPIVSINLEGK